jgi:hypothetical protein
VFTGLLDLWMLEKCVNRVSSVCSVLHLLVYTEFNVAIFLLSMLPYMQPVYRRKKSTWDAEER